MAVLVVVCAAAVLAADLSMPLGVAGGVPYIGVVLLGWWVPRAFWIFVIAALCALLTVVGYTFSPAGVETWIVLVNRAYALLAIGLTASLLAVAKKARAELLESERARKREAGARSRPADEIGRKPREHIDQADKIDALRNLVGGIAHDFNNALFPIIGLTESTVAKLPAGSEEQTNLLKALEAAHHARSLVRQVLAFSRQEPTDRRPERLTEILREAIKFIKASLPANIEVRERIDENVGLVFADATQIRQVIINLASNARDAIGRSGGSLEIRLSSVEIGSDDSSLAPGQYFRIDVSDTGRGMDQATVERIFEPFFTTKRGNQGHGLGLSVAYGIVRAHNGAITVASQPGQGTVFSVYLPKTSVDDGSPGSGDERS